MSGRCFLIECDKDNKKTIVDRLMVNSYYSKIYLFSADTETFPKALKSVKNHVKVWADEKKIDVTQNALILLDMDELPITEKEWNKLLSDCPLYKIDIKGITSELSNVPPWIIIKCPFISKME